MSISLLPLPGDKNKLEPMPINHIRYFGYSQLLVFLQQGWHIQIWKPSHTLLLLIAKSIWVRNNISKQFNFCTMVTLRCCGGDQGLFQGSSHHRWIPRCRHLVLRCVTNCAAKLGMCQMPKNICAFVNLMIRLTWHIHVQPAKALSWWSKLSRASRTMYTWMC